MELSILPGSFYIIFAFPCISTGTIHFVIFPSSCKFVSILKPVSATSISLIFRKISGEFFIIFIFYSGLPFQIIIFPVTGDHGSILAIVSSFSLFYINILIPPCIAYISYIDVPIIISKCPRSSHHLTGLCDSQRKNQTNQHKSQG